MRDDLMSDVARILRDRQLQRQLDREADLSFMWRVLKQKRGSRR